jgi:hypothetical protein
MNNLRCSSNVGSAAAAAFLAAHANLEVLEMTLAGPICVQQHALPPGSLPRLRDLRSNRDMINAVLSCPTDPPRPLEVIRGVRLTGSVSDHNTTSSPI